MRTEFYSKMKKLKVLTFLGTRPEIISFSRGTARLYLTANHKIAHTGQNWDYGLNEEFFFDLEVR